MDPDGKFYVSWYVVRTWLADQFVMSVFDPEFEKPVHIKPILFTNCKIPPEQLFLKGRTLFGGTKFEYSGAFVIADPADPFVGEGNWALTVDNRNIKADLKIKSSIPYFTKFDYNIRDRYGLMHFFHNRTTGTVEANGKTYNLNNALTYYDHCWGRIPRRTGWHWLAVQNEKAGIASLINYGAYAQLYTQVYFTADVKSPRTDEWVRLSQTVSFEFRDQDKWKQTWHVTSPDMDLAVEIFQLKTDRTYIPAVMMIWHTEVFVRASGVIRVDGDWVETGDMFGVMEEHKGYW